MAVMEIDGSASLEIFKVTLALNTDQRTVLTSLDIGESRRDIIVKVQARLPSLPG